MVGPGELVKRDKRCALTSSIRWSYRDFVEMPRGHLAERGKKCKKSVQIFKHFLHPFILVAEGNNVRGTCRYIFQL